MFKLTQENQLDPVRRNGGNSFYVYSRTTFVHKSSSEKKSEFSKYQKMDGGILTVSGTMAVNESVEKHLSKVFGPD